MLDMRTEGREEAKCRVSATQDLTAGKHLYKQIDDDYA